MPLHFPSALRAWYENVKFFSVWKLEEKNVGRKWDRIGVAPALLRIVSSLSFSYVDKATEHFPIMGGRDSPQSCILLLCL